MKKILVSFIIFFFTQYSCAMTHGRLKQVEIPRKTTALFSPEYQLINSMICWLKQLPSGSKISVANNYLTHTPFTKALVEAKKRGSSVHIIIDQESFTRDTARARTLENLQLLHQAGIDATIYNYNKALCTPQNNPQCMHLKTLFWKEPQTKESNATYVTVSSSSNLSSNAELNNLEHLTYVYNNKNLYKEFKTLFNSLTKNQLRFSDTLNPISAMQNPSLKPAPLIRPGRSFKPNATTQWPCMISSPQYNLIETLTDLVSHAKKGEGIFISSFSVHDTKNFEPALMQAAQKGVTVMIITDKSCARKHEQSLKNLSNACNVFITDEETGYNHHKFMLFIRKESVWLIEGSTNFTYSGSHEINKLTLHKNNKTLINKFSNAFNQARKNAVKLQDFSWRHEPLSKINGADQTPI